MKTPLILIAAALLVACSRPLPPPPAPRPVVTMTIGAAAVAGLAVYAGEIRARHEADLSFRIGGKLVERRVDLGDRVRRGQMLARLDAGDAELAAAAATAQRAAAEADLALARAEYERARSLAEKKFVSGTVVDTRHAQWQAAAARLDQLRAQASVAGNQVGYTTLHADRDGVITAVPGEAGQVVSAGQAVVRIADPAEREVLIHVPESRIGGVRPGRPALVRPWATPETTLAGRVREVAASADTATRTFAVRVAVPEAGAALALGTTAAVGFPDETRDALSVPLAAVLERDGRTQVWTVGSDDKVVAKAVEIGPFSDDAVRVRSGLAAGDRVVIVGAHALTAGMTVRAIAASAPPALDARR